MSEYTWVIYSLLAAVSAALVVTLTKAGLKNVEPNVGFAVQAIMILLISWIITWWQGQVKEVSEIGGKAWLFLLAAGVLTALSSLLTFNALKLGEASQVSPFDKVSLVFAIIFAVIFLKEKVTWQIICGAILIVTGAILIASSTPKDDSETGRQNNIQRDKKVGES